MLAENYKYFGDLLIYTHAKIIYLYGENLTNEIQLQAKV